MVEQHSAQCPCVGSSGEMLGMLGPVPTGDIIKSQRGLRLLGLGDERLGPLALLPFYDFSFSPGGLFRRAEKATTVDLEVVRVERRPRVASDRHRGSFRV